MQTVFVAPKRTIATETNPYARAMDFILTDFLPNANAQAIAPEEAERIIASAKGMPIKYEPIREGHAGAFPIGVIEQVWSGVDPITNQPCLYARAVLWESEYPEIVQQLKTEFEQTGTLAVSWELVYERSEVRDGVEWLYDVTVVGVAIVEQPAYGKTRTRVLRVAETQPVGEEKRMDELQRELDTLRAELEQYRARAEHAEAELRLISRARALAAVLPEPLLEQQAPLLRTLTDEQFEAYRAALHAVVEHYRGDARVVSEPERAAASIELTDVQRRGESLSRGYPRSALSDHDPVAILVDVLRNR